MIFWDCKKNKKTKNKHWVDFYHGFAHTLPTHIYVQTPCKSEFCI